MPSRIKVRVDMHLTGAQREVQRTGRKAVNEVAREIERTAKRIVPVRTGYTRSTIRAHPARVAGPWRVSASVSAGGAAGFITSGTRPHVIRARRGSVLHFLWHGREVFFRSVQHPGTKPYPFLDIAAARVAARHRGTHR